MTFEVQTSKTGAAVLVVNQKRLSSLYDPAKEAQVWVKGLSKAQTQVDLIVFLGAGHGEAIKALLSATAAQVLVVSSVEAALTFWKSRIDDQRVTWLHLDDKNLHNYFKTDEFLHLSRSVYSVIESPSAKNEDEKFFKKMKEIFLGRTYSSFKKMAAASDELSSLSTVILPAIGLLSIKNICDHLVLAPDLNEKDVAQWSVLRELVK